jgi:hypothetical protein
MGRRHEEYERLDQTLLGQRLLALAAHERPLATGRIVIAPVGAPRTQQRLAAARAQPCHRLGVALRGLRVVAGA